MNDHKTNASIEQFITWYKKNMPKNIALVPNHPRYELICDAIAKISYLAKSEVSDVKIDIYPTPLSPYGIVLSIVASSVIITDIKAFCSHIEMASNFEAEALTSGDVRFNVLFNNAYKAAPPNC